VIRRSAVALLLAVAALVAAPAAGAQVAPTFPTAQGGPKARLLEVDRVVGVVGTTPILFSEVLEQVNFARSNGREIPSDSAGQMRVAREVLNEMIDQEILVTLAREYKIEVPESDVSDRVDQRIANVRNQFRTEPEYRAALVREGFGTPEEYRRRTIEQAIRGELQKRAVDSLKAKGRLAPANVTESEVAEAFARLRSQLPPRPATLAFRQIVIPPAPRPENVLRARVLTDSLRIELEKGADFDSLARRFSMDPGSAERGGDLDWQRRGAMVAPFERMMFALPPGRISPIVETQYGFHVIRVDRVRAAEVRARHILIKPTVDSADVLSARARADSALALWKAGTPYDSLVARFHDADEEKTIPEYPRDSLPAEYRVAFRDVPAGGFAPVFALPDPASGFNKWAVAQVISEKPAGEYTLAEYQERIRAQLREERSIRRTLDKLRTEFYVSIRL